jgi:hypothetical protein
MLPATLDQYSRSRLAHYTGYKPHGGAGATAVQPAHGPTAETTQGFANLQVLKNGPQPAHSRHAINSRKVSKCDATLPSTCCTATLQIHSCKLHWPQPAHKRYCSLLDCS